MAPTPETEIPSGSHAEFLGWRFVDYETLNREPSAEASSEASAAGVEGMSLGGRDDT